MQISRGNGGWHRIDGDLGLPGKLYARVRAVDGRPRITELYVDGDGEPIQAAALRRLPLSQLEVWMSDMGGADDDVAGPDLSRLASFYASSWEADTYAGRHCDECNAPLRGSSTRAEALGREEALTDWAALSWFAQYAHLVGYGIPQVRRPKERRHPVDELPEPVLSAPVAGLTDEFLTDVARAYSAAVMRELPPATTLAELSGYPRRTVESWIYKARKRGLMAPAPKRGRVV
jgi:hypothetical protein